MKKVLLLLVCLFTLQTVVWADDDKPIQVDVYKRQVLIQSFHLPIKILL